MQVVYDGVKRENTWMGLREWHARRYKGVSEWGEEQMIIFFYAREDD